ncbi:MAG: hypothetical protein ACRBFS_06215 [Aureispira sp.]
MLNKTFLLGLTTLLALIAFTSCSNIKDVVYINELTQEKISKNRLERITNLWVGHFSNKGQEQGNAEQEIIGRRIWKKNRVDEHWIYTGWFQTDSYESALSSSIAQITRISPDTAFITFYRIKDNIEIDPYEWKKDQPFKELKRSDLESCGEGCGSFIVDQEGGDYQVIANKPCHSPISAQIQYYEIDAKMTTSNITFSTRFLDSQFNIVMTNEGSIFSRFTRSELEKKYESFASVD